MPNADWDFDVLRVDLNGLSIDAGQRLGMVIAQPHFDLIPDGAVSFRIADEFRAAQIALIEQTFRIRAAESEQRGVPIPFILFPEGAIPVGNPDGLDCIRRQLEQVPGDAVFIGGLEGLSPEEMRAVAERWAPEGPPRPDFAAGAFVNSCVIAVKFTNGDLRWHFQAKLRPSQWEQPRNMAHGRRVLYFVAPQVSFLCQICFDHVAAQGQDSINTALCHRIITVTQPNAAALDFIFVPQYNPSPNLPVMRQNSGRLLNHQDRLLQNNQATVVVVNRASTTQDSSEYGRSGFHYRKGRWRVPVSDLGPKGYELCEPDDVTSAVFRKRTQALHVATLVPPSHNAHDPGNPRLPLENPRSFLIGGENRCPCLVGIAGGRGVQFVECECLPCKLHDVLFAALPAQDGRHRWQGSDAAQSEILGRHYQDLRATLLSLGTERSRELVFLLLKMHDSEIGNRHNPDLWGEPQSEAIIELLAGLSVLKELQPINFQTKKPWTALSGESLALVLLDGEGKRKRWGDMVSDYQMTFEGQYLPLEMRRKPVLLVSLRSGGLIQPLVKPHPFEFTDPMTPNRLGDADAYTTPTPVRFFVCQDSLFEGARQSPAIVDFLNTEMRCILE